MKTPTPRILFSGISPTVGDTGIGLAILQGLRRRSDLPVHAYVDRPGVFRALPELAGPGDAVHERLVWAVPAVGGRKTYPRTLRLARALARDGGRAVLDAEAFARVRGVFEGAAGLVFQGGPTWNDRWLKPRMVLQNRLLLSAARFYRVPAFQLGVGCGPFDLAGPRGVLLRPLLRSTLDLHTGILVRDDASGPALRRLGVRAQVVESTDAAVFLRPREDPAAAPLAARIAAGQRPRVGVCVRDYQANYPDALARREKVFAELAATLDRVQRDHADVFFLGTDRQREASAGKPDDVATARGVRARMAVPGSVVLDEPVEDPAALKHLYGLFDAVVSLRLHPVIFALAQGVPCHLVSYDPKCDAFLASLGPGFGERILRPDAFAAAEAADRVAADLADAAVRGRIRAAFDGLRARHAGDWEPVHAAIAQRTDELRPGP
ncbi:polysaccharide pyruvyl transferase family protein [Phycisphaera mikurensis]|uniref:Putative polysaccharide pyruvyl transferase n=1 Tax=Phycisphaera mikurensis (strain NBRC 102666 / KCTC 22515 / FYK2301M01) TaxID=1142394 RepID=I0IE38_PHYMF|nr:polysaccharide pyruvyl transferase family protein [Phycisphaera mikurensis]BAM03526.1 putative polysaccharide pyruvyl transferase [Phycisphaera mikurensis NBRC 102666]